MSFSLFSPQKCLFIDSVLQEVSLVCISEPSVRRTVLQLCKVVVGSGNLALLENLCCSLLQSYLLVSLIKKITIRIFNLRSWGQDVVFFFFFKCYSQKSWKFLLLFRDKFCFVFLQYNDSDVVQFTYIVLTLPDGLFPLFLTTWEAFSFITASFWATSHPLPRSVVTLFSFMQISSVCNLSLMWRHI